MKSTFLKLSLAATLLQLIVLSPAHANLLYSNGNVAFDSGRCDQGPNGCGIYDGGSFTVYDDFSLANDSSVTGFDYNGYFHHGAYTRYRHTRWSIWSDLPTNAGAQQFYSGTNVATVTSDVAGSYLFSISDLNLDLTSGMYWLGITNMVMEGTLTTFATTDQAVTLGGACQIDTAINYCHHTYYERAFNIYGTSEIPLPAAAWLLASGLFGLAGVQNLKKRQRSQ